MKTSWFWPSSAANDGMSWIRLERLKNLSKNKRSSMVEVPESLHKKYHNILHGLKDNGQSFRNNPELSAQYDSFRKRYWKWRAQQFEKQQ
ncbi:HNH/ENDO VII family nuclease [Bacillus vallismortis]|uniref:HNH/ENDO VII family nuclease n=1 Tax=Bacillus TaxID=1386 RepID=UPI0035303DAB